MLAILPRPVDADTISALLVAPIAVACGFPSPAQDYYDGPIDLTSMLVEDQAATFIVRASGHSMTGAGISDGDELLVDRSKRPQHGDVIVAVLDGELTVKRLELTAAGVVLRSENSEHPDIIVAELSDLQVWGVATFTTCGSRPCLRMSTSTRPTRHSSGSSTRPSMAALSWS